MKRKHIIVLLVVLVAAAGIFIGKRPMLNRADSSFELLKNEGIAEIDLSAIKDGVYIGRTVVPMLPASAIYLLSFFGILGISCNL